MAPLSVTQRLDFHTTDAEAFKSIIALERYIHARTLGESLIALVKLRASHINRCAFCLDMHSRDARKAGIDQRKIDIVDAWREAPSFYSEREQAALALTEEVTLIRRGGVSDETWEWVAANYSEKEIVELLMTISAINTWNRLAISTHMALPGQPGTDRAQAAAD